MVLSIYNPGTQELVRGGIAQNTLNNNGSKTQRMVEQAVQKMFKQWPEE